MRKPCRAYGCPHLVPYGVRFCDIHKQLEIELAVKEFKPKRIDEKQKRFYNSSFWKRTREFALAREALCRSCGKNIATDVDHIDGNYLNNKPENLQSLCHSCHSKKTNKHDRGGFRRMKKKRKNKRAPTRWGTDIMW